MKYYICFIDLPRPLCAKSKALKADVKRLVLLGSIGELFQRPTCIELDLGQLLLTLGLGISMFAQHFIGLRIHPRSLVAGRLG